jgi:hypothetical protein
MLPAETTLPAERKSGKAVNADAGKPSSHMALRADDQSIKYGLKWLKAWEMEPIKPSPVSAPGEKIAQARNPADHDASLTQFSGTRGWRPTRRKEPNSSSVWSLSRRAGPNRFVQGTFSALPRYAALSCLGISSPTEEEQNMFDASHPRVSGNRS